MSHWMPVSDWHDVDAPVPAINLRRLSLFEVYMAKRRKARYAAAVYRIHPFNPELPDVLPPALDKVI